MSAKFNSVEDFRRAAKCKLPRMVFDYVEGGAGSERGLTRNRRALEALTFSPARLIDISTRDQTISPFGRIWSSPFAIAPMGLNGAVRPDGDIILARAAAKAGLPFVLSTASTSSMEDVAKASNGELWFQLYVLSRDFANKLVSRAMAIGCNTLVLTVDVKVNGQRLRDQRSGFSVPLKMRPGILWDCMSHPRWSLDQWRHGFPKLAHFADAGGDIAAQKALMERRLDASFGWNDLKKLRDLWRGTLIVKGLLREADITQCLNIGVDGVVLSNHGGRQLEDAVSPIEMLARLPARPPAPVLIHSGIRDGDDILKALALGASGVLIGRPMLYALAADGQAGVESLIALLKSQIDNCMAQVGCSAIDNIVTGDGVNILF